MIIRYYRLLIKLHWYIHYIHYIHTVQCWKGVQKRVARISKYKMISFDDFTNENKTEHNPKWPDIPDHS